MTMKNSTAQKMRLGIVVFAFTFMLFWCFVPGPTLQRVLGITAGACMMLSMLISYFHEKKQIEK